MRKYLIVLIVAVLILIVWIGTTRHRPTDNTARDRAALDEARLSLLETRQRGYEQESEAIARGVPIPPPYAKPLTSGERAEIEELRRRVGQWRADHPGNR